MICRSTTSHLYTWEATTRSGARAVWLAWVPNQKTPLAWATPTAPTTIWADPVNTSAPAAM